MHSRSKRPTTPPAFDVAKFAKDSDARLRTAAPIAQGPLPTSESRLITRPEMGAAVTDEAWARAMKGVPVVVVATDQLRRLPLDHRTGFLVSLMDGTIDLPTIVEVSAMPQSDALRVIRDLYEAGVVEFR